MIVTAPTPTASGGGGWSGWRPLRLAHTPPSTTVVVVRRQASVKTQAPCRCVAGEDGGRGGVGGGGEGGRTLRPSATCRQPRTLSRASPPLGLRPGVQAGRWRCRRRRRCRQTVCGPPHRRCWMQLNRTLNRMACSGTGNRMPIRSGVCSGNRRRTGGDSIWGLCYPRSWVVCMITAQMM